MKSLALAQQLGAALRQAERAQWVEGGTVGHGHRAAGQRCPSNRPVAASPPCQPGMPTSPCACPAYLGFRQGQQAQQARRGQQAQRAQRRCGPTGPPAPRSCQTPAIIRGVMGSREEAHSGQDGTSQRHGQRVSLAGYRSRRSTAAAGMQASHMVRGLLSAGAAH